MSDCLLTAIREYNARVLEWLKEPSTGSRIAGLMTENLFHWQSLGVHDADQFCAYVDVLFYKHLFRRVYNMAPPDDLARAFQKAHDDERAEILHKLYEIHRTDEEEYHIFLKV